jgi:hypothetical protein
MKTIGITLALAFCLCGIAQAGPFTDEMSKCLVRKTTDPDKVLFIQWIYAAMSSHPDVKAMSSISQATADALNKRAAGMMMELLTVRCKTETAQAMKYEGTSAFQASFEILGKVAMQGLMSDPNVAQYVKGLDRYFDADRLKNALGQK